MFLPAVLVLAPMCGCTDRSADLQRRITHLEDELDRARAEGEAATTADAEQPIEGESETAVLARIARSYEAAASRFGTELKAQLGGAEIGLSSDKPRIESHPFQSVFSLEIRSDGKPVQIRDIPARGSFDGRWSFPSVAEVRAMIEQAKAPVVARAAREVRPAASGVAAPSASDQTVVIDWGGGSGGIAGAAAPLPAAAPAPAPATAPAAAEPTRVMPSSKDVYIKF